MADDKTWYPGKHADETFDQLLDVTKDALVLARENQRLSTELEEERTKVAMGEHHLREEQKLRDAAEAKVAALTADKARLDWLDRTNLPFRMGWSIGCAPAGNVSVSSVIQLGREPVTIREAIDAAIATKEGQRVPDDAKQQT